MELIEADCTDIEQRIIRKSETRKYTTNLFESKYPTWSIQPEEHIFYYDENPVIEYVFKDGYGISGNRQNGMFGIFHNNKFYYKDFAKQAVAFRKDSEFWNENNGSLEIVTNNPHLRVYDSAKPVNMLFSINLYWHWFCEDLPTIYTMLTENEHKVFINKLNEWQKESLTMMMSTMNLDFDDRINELDTPCIVNAPLIYTYSYPAMSFRGKSSHWVAKLLNERLKPSFAQNTYEEKIYISRGDAEARVVENESEVIDTLKQKGFIIYDNFSKLSVQQKVDIFHKSSIVISPTGAGLTHCHSMRPGTTVIDFNHEFELREECGWNNIGTANEIDWITFSAITSYEPAGSAAGGVKAKNRNLIVDIGILEKVLQYAMDKGF